ncbi:hypothetical protein GGF31_003048 [Allomyces arbusculus]|nr:hypothetical protein GGF31_003048 [Allomyces arbusculus]
MSSVPAPLLAFGVLVIAAVAFGAVSGLVWWVRQPSPADQTMASTTLDVEKAPARPILDVPFKTQLEPAKPMHPAICSNKLIAPVPAAHVKQSRHDPHKRRPSAQEAARWSTAADVISSRANRHPPLHRNRVGAALIDASGGDKAVVSRWLDAVPGPNKAMRSLPRSRSGPLPSSRMRSTRTPAPLAVPDVSYMGLEPTLPSPTSTATLKDAPGSRSASPFPMRHHSRTAKTSSMHSQASAWCQNPMAPSCGSVGGGVYMAYSGVFPHSSLVASAPALTQAGPIAPQPVHLPPAAWHSGPAAFAHPLGQTFV